MEGGRRLAVELHSLGRLTTTSPSVLAASSGSVRRVWMAVLGGENEERVSPVEILPVLVRAYAIGVAVGEEILRGHVSPVGEALQEGRRLANELLALLDGLLDFHDVPGSGGGYGEGF